MGIWLSLLCGLFFDYPGSGPRQAAVLAGWALALAAGLYWERRVLKRSGHAFRGNYWPLRWLIAAASGAAGVSVVYLRSIQAPMGRPAVAAALAFFALVSVSALALAAREELKRAESTARPSYAALWKLSLRQDAALAALGLMLVLAGQAEPPQKPPSLPQKERWLPRSPLEDF